MGERTLEINVISARGLKDVNYISKMDVYAVVSISGGDDSKQKPKQKTKTPVDRSGGKNPTWNFPIKFTIPQTPLAENRLNVVFNLKCERALGDKDVGEVNVPVKELLDSAGDGKSMKFVSYQVRKPSGKPKGEVSFSFKFSGIEKVVVPEVSTAAAAKATNSSSQPVTAYAAVPVVGPSSVPYAGPGSYPPPPPGHEYPPPPPGYGYPPPPPYGGYATPPQPRYGYPPPGAEQERKITGGQIKRNCLKRLKGPPPSTTTHPSLRHCPPPPGYGYQPAQGGYVYPPQVQGQQPQKNKSGMGSPGAEQERKITGGQIKRDCLKRLKFQLFYTGPPPSATAHPSLRHCPPPPGYGYQPAQGGYGYPPQVQGQQPQKNKSGMGSPGAEQERKITRGQIKRNCLKRLKFQLFIQGPLPPPLPTKHLDMDINLLKGGMGTRHKCKGSSHKRINLEWA